VIDAVIVVVIENVAGQKQWPFDVVFNRPFKDEELNFMREMSATVGPWRNVIYDPIKM